MPSPYLDRDGLEYFYLKLRPVINSKADNALATTTANGLMSATDKAKLDGIGSGANQYTLPVASASTLGGIKVGTNLSINASTGVLSATDTTYSVFSTSENGLVPKASASGDTSKFLRGDGTWQAANNYSLPTASASVLGGIKVGTNLSISNGVLSATDTTYSPATTSNNGLMSAADKTKLDGLPTNATLASTYAKKSDITTLFSFKGSVASQSNLPTASASTLGHVYNVTDTGMNYVGIQDGSTYKWDAFGSVFSISDITNAQIDAIIEEYPMATTVGSNVEAMTTSEVNAILT